MKSMWKPRLAMDVDGVLADFSFGIRYAVWGRFGYVPSLPKGWKMETIARDHFEWFWQHSNYDFWANLPLRPGVEEYFHKVTLGVEYVIVSNCPDSNARRDWLHRHKLDTKALAVIIQPPESDKVKVVQDLHCDWLLEDNPPTIEHALEAGLNCVFFQNFLSHSFKPKSGLGTPQLCVVNGGRDLMSMDWAEGC